MGRRRGRSLRHCRADAVDTQLRHFDVEIALHDKRGRAALDRIGREFVAVARQPWYAEEQRPGSNEPIFVDKAGDLGIPLPGSPGAGKDLIQPHRRQSSGLTAGLGGAIRPVLRKGAPLTKLRSLSLPAQELPGYPHTEIGAQSIQRLRQLHERDLREGQRQPRQRARVHAIGA